MKLTRAFRIGHRDVVALVGGGGKSRTLMGLASELAAEGRRVVTMTTTSIARYEAERIVCYRLPPAGVSLDGLEDLLSQHLHVMVVGSRAGTLGSTSMGVTMEEAVRVSGLSFVDNTIIEADGARMLPFKAPAGHEPAVPPTTTLLVPVVGVDILGRPLTTEYVHRPELVAQLAGVDLHTDVTAEVVASVLTHPQGGLKGVSAGVRVVPLINKIAHGQTAGQGESLAQARDLADRLLACPRISHVVLGVHEPGSRTEGKPSALSSEPVLGVRTRVAAVVLAAGGASRYGQLKQLLPWGEGTLLSQVVDTALASKASPVVVVLGNHAQECRQALGDRPVEVVVNSLWAQGQSTSVRAGLALLPDTVSAAFFPLADSPLLTAATMDALIERYWRTFAPVVWPEHDGKRGNPVLFDRALFSQLNQLTEDTGGRSVLKSYLDQAERVPVPDAGILKDIDTPQDYATYRQPTSGSNRP